MPRQGQPVRFLFVGPVPFLGLKSPYLACRPHISQPAGMLTWILSLQLLAKKAPMNRPTALGIDGRLTPHAAAICSSPIPGLIADICMGLWQP
jgi:hypothetical protein